VDIMDASPENVTLDRLTTCPICFEEKPDVCQLVHSDPQGDVSSHKMCADCLARCPECPWCRDVMIKDELVCFLQDFVSAFDCSASANAHTASSMDDLRDERAEFLQRWEIFELQYEGNPRVVRSVARLLLEDASFSQLLELALTEKKDWLFETAGIIFRLHGMSKDGELPEVDAHCHSVLAKAVQQILKPFEEMRPDLNGTFYGALYMQAVVPFLSAQRACGAPSPTLKATVERVASAMVARYRVSAWKARFKAGALENMHEQLLQQIQISVWGSQREDPVWNLFYEPRLPESVPLQPLVSAPAGSRAPSKRFPCICCRRRNASASE